MGKVFLSHSSKDKEKYVRIVAKKLINSIGLNNVVYDECTFEEGMEAIEEIEKGLDKTDLFVIFISNAALESKWVKTELINAKKLKNDGIINRIYPIIIDESIVYSDERIPKWMRNKYNIKLIKNPNKAFMMISRRILEINWDNYPKIKEKSNIFVGRNDYLKSFEERYYQYDSSLIINSIIASGIKNIGRKSLVERCLKNVDAIKEEAYIMPKITLSYLESLEDFILKIYDLGFSDPINFDDLGKKTIEEKIDIAINLLADIEQSKEIIHVEDEGGIVTHDGEIMEWFLEINKKLRFKDRITFVVTSKFKVTTPELWNYKNIYTIEVNEFKKKETMGLLNRYLTYYGISIETDEFNKILELLTGFPEQVEYAVYLIKNNGIRWTIKNSSLIVQFNTERVIQLLSDIENDEDKQSFLMFLCSFDYIGYDFIFEVLPKEELATYEQYLNDFFNRSICEYVGSNKEYLKVNSSIKDYILRKNVKLDEKYKTRLTEVVKGKLAILDSQINNVPEFLFTIKESILNGEDIDEKYIIPSHYLTVMNELYNNKKEFSEVVKLADKALENEKYMDKRIIFEIRNLLCLSLAKLRDKRFLEEVHKISGAEHNFLMGFYYRQINKNNKALEKLLKSLEQRKNYAKARRELVQVYISLQDYDKARVLAEQNYANDTSNPFHIQAYFTCIIKSEKSDKNREVLEELLEMLSKIKSQIADEMLLRCKAEFEAFYNDDEDYAIELINTDIDKYPRLSYALLVKFDICERFNRIDEMEDIVKKLRQNNYTKTYYNNTIIYYEAICMAKRGSKGEAIKHVSCNFRNYTEDSLNRVKNKISRIIPID